MQNHSEIYSMRKKIIPLKCNALKLSLITYLVLKKLSKSLHIAGTGQSVSVWVFPKARGQMFPHPEENTVNWAACCFSV